MDGRFEMCMNRMSSNPVTCFLVTWVGEESVPTKLDVVLGLAHGLVVVAKSVRLGVAVGSLDDDVLRRTENH